MVEAENHLSDEGSDQLNLCVCVPARNEAFRLPKLLEALAGQSWPSPVPVVIVLNNTTDDSALVIAKARIRFADRLALHLFDVTFPREAAHAGSARRMAMEEGLRVLPTHREAVLVSTDADSRPPSDWLTNIAKALRSGADMVGGRILLEPDEVLPPHVLGLRNAWDQYWEAVRDIEDAIDPVTWDPAPRHGDHTGASLAIKAALYREVGGVPPIPTGEDQALVTAAIAAGGRLAHPADVFTYVSPRRRGRAQGGMAASMDTLFALADADTLPMAPAFEHWRERAAWRLALRERPNGSRLIAEREPMLPPMPHDMILAVNR